MNSNTMSKDEYNQMVLEQVDTEGYATNVDCPNCDNKAHRHDFEASHTGSVNQHYTLDCKHCGHHECDQDSCSICEQEPEGAKGYNEAGNLSELVEEILQTDLLKNGHLSPVKWTATKIYIHKNPELVYWYNLIFNEIDNEDITIVQFIENIKLDIYLHWTEHKERSELILD